jgi:hypothetical protein
MKAGAAVADEPKVPRLNQTVIASEAKQSRTKYDALDCFVALLLVMTVR